MIDLKKSLEFVNKMNALNTDTRKKILDIVRKSDKPISITDIHKALEKNKYKIAYKNVAENIKVLEQNDIVKVEKVRDSVGQRSMISLSETGLKVINFICSIGEFMVDDKLLNKQRKDFKKLSLP